MKKNDDSDTEVKGYKNLFLQVFQLRNFIGTVGGGAGIFLLLYSEADKWKKVEPFFFIWIGLVVSWLLLILLIYKGELENRVISFIIALIKRIVPILIIFISLYLILLPLEFKKTLGIILLTILSLFILRNNKKLSELSNSSRGVKINNKSKRTKGKIITLKDWTATETNNEQGTNYREVNLLGKPLKILEFRVKPYTTFWRAGFKITDPNGSILPLRTNNSFLFHVGSTEFRSKFGVTVYINGDWVPDVNKTIDFDNEGFVSIRFEVNEKKFVKCFINNKIEFKPKERIDPRILEKVFLAAWGDGNPYRVEFGSIGFTAR